MSAGPVGSSKIMKTGRAELYVFLSQPEAVECLGYLYLVMIQNTLDMGIRNWLQMDINQTIRVDNTTQNNSPSYQQNNWVKSSQVFFSAFENSGWAARYFVLNL